MWGEMWHDMQMWGGGMWMWMWPILLVGLGILAYLIYSSLRPRVQIPPRRALC